MSQIRDDKQAFNAFESAKPLKIGVYRFTLTLISIDNN